MGDGGMWSDALYVVFFFKEKTAYEMRISDWSSDVCSSDLADLVVAVARVAVRAAGALQDRQHQRLDAGLAVAAGDGDHPGGAGVLHRRGERGQRALGVGDQHLRDRKSTRLNSSH